MIVINQNYKKIISFNGNLKKLAQALSLPFFRFFSSKEKEYLIKIFSSPKNSLIDPGLKIKVYELLIKLQKLRRSAFGFLLVLGWEKRWTKEFVSFPDASQNIFKNEELDLNKTEEDKILKKLLRITDFDGAVLVDKKGKVIASGVYLENMRPAQVIAAIGKKNFSDLSEAFGFYKKVHTRHLSGVACSYWFSDTLVYVISEEDRSFRIFENGKIIYSTYRKETEWNR